MRIFAMGDIHGSAANFAAAWDALCAANHHGMPERGDAIICCGDVGIKYGRYVSLSLLSEMADMPCDFVVLRGNHDTRYWRDMDNRIWPDRFETIDWCGGPVRRDPEYPNVLYLPDGGGLYSLDGHPALMVPGAWSIDNYIRRRVPDMPYEYEEQLFPEERQHMVGLAASNPIEYVFSHTCPISWMPYLSDYLICGVSQSDTDKTMEHMLEEVLCHVKPTLHHWYFGHFHGDTTLAQGKGHLLFSDILEVPLVETN